MHTYGTNEVQRSVQNIRLGAENSTSPVRMSNTFRSTLQFGNHEKMYPKNNANKVRHSSINLMPVRNARPNSMQTRKLSVHNF